MIVKFVIDSGSGDAGHCRNNGFSVNLRSSDRHRRVTIGLGTLRFDLRKRVTLQFECELDSQVEFPITIHVDDEAGQSKVFGKFLPGIDRRRISLFQDLKVDKIEKLTFIFHKKIDGVFSIENFSIINGRTRFRLCDDVFQAEVIDTVKKWYQRDKDLCVSSYLGDYFLRIPFEWEISKIPAENLKIAEYFLFDRIESSLFSEKDSISSLLKEIGSDSKSLSRNSNDGALLAFSFGEDSTAAASVIPNDAFKYYSKRIHSEYRIGSGALIKINPYSVYEIGYKRLENLLIVENNLEKIALAAGIRHGFSHNFGYASIGVLLAPFLPINTLCFGSVMEQVFLKSGINFTDIGGIKSSQYNNLKKLLGMVGLHFALPVGICSEVVTSRICEVGPLAGVAFSCPNVSDTGVECGICFKCFRKARMRSELVAAPPSNYVLDVLQKRPLKSATSLVFALQKAGDDKLYCSDYSDTDLNFLSKFFSGGLSTICPQWLQPVVLNSLSKMGFNPMSDLEEIKLRSIGKVFDPDNFDCARSGLQKHVES